jgi:hypothetical protein
MDCGVAAGRAHSGTVEWQFEKFIEFQNKNRQPQKPPI